MNNKQNPSKQGLNYLALESVLKAMLSTPPHNKKSKSKQGQKNVN